MRTYLTALIPEETVSAALRIHSLDGWIAEEEPLGEGEFGEVYKYSTPLPDWPVAAGKHLKVENLFNLNKAQEKELSDNVQEFLKEINILHEVSVKQSERILKIIGCYYDIDKIILFTELLTNGSVRHHIRQAPLEEKKALKYFYQTCEALQVLHHLKPKPIVHRDIKCENLLLTEEDNIKLADFGLAFSLEVNSLSMTMSASAATEECGTELYTAPEVLLGSPYGRGADIWSLACTLVEMLTREPPHQNTWSDYSRRKDAGAAVESFRRRVSSTEPDEQLEYSGTLFLPAASEEIRLLLDCLFMKDKKIRPKIDDIVNLFSRDDANGGVQINIEKVRSLKDDILAKVAQSVN